MKLGMNVLLISSVFVFYAFWSVAIGQVEMLQPVDFHSQSESDTLTRRTLSELTVNILDRFEQSGESIAEWRDCLPKAAIICGFSRGDAQGTDDEVTKINTYLSELAIEAEAFYPPEETLAYSDIERFDVIIYDNGGWDWYNKKNGTGQNIVDVLTQALNHGKPLYLIGDDMALSADAYTIGASYVTHLVSTTNNGSFGVDIIDITVPDHPIMSGPYGFVNSFSYTRDIDVTQATNQGEIVVAINRWTNKPVILTYVGPLQNRVVVQIAGVYGACNGIVSDSEGLAKLKKLFCNSVIWLLNFHETCEPPDLIKVRDFTGHTGQRVSTDITMYQNQNPVDAFGLRVTFDNTVFAFDTVEACDLTTNWIIVSGDETGPGVITIGGFNTVPISPGTTGSIARVSFEVVQCQSRDTSQVCCQGLTDDLANWAWPCCGKFTSGICERGDVNCDGAITMSDALCAYWRFALGSFQPECGCECSEESAEVTCDGFITPGDALCIFWRSILGDWTGECECLETVVKSRSKLVDRLFIESMRGTPGSIIRIPVMVENPRGLDAFAFQLLYPAELLEFEKISTTSATEDWTILDAGIVRPGVLIIGGFHIEAISYGAFMTLVEVDFQVNQSAKGSGELIPCGFMDDLVGAYVKHGDFIVEDIPTDYSLSQNYPNPFNTGTRIEYALPNASHVRLDVYNVLGQHITTLVNETKEVGFHTFYWDGRNSTKQEVPSGIYFYRFQTGEYFQTKRMLFLK
ncbi:MAG: T9SS type A sorting domain-containing protein [Gemmatimonadota bacterium]|nr:MAG: T9SS type A sorting domain-containing protein [Gemmatimonadota bacterium]